MEEESKKICFTSKEEEFKAESKRREERRDTIIIIKQAAQVSNRMKNSGMTMPWQIPDLVQDFIKCYFNTVKC